MEASGTVGQVIALDQIQGNIAGFNKPFQRFVFLRFPGKAEAQRFLHVTRREVDSAAKVAEANRSYKWRRAHGQEPEPKKWLNLLLSISGLRVLEAPELDLFEGAFQEGMSVRAEHLGDKDESAPGKWQPLFREGEIHALAILAADLEADLEHIHSHLRGHIHASKLEELGALDGHARPGDKHSHEHFGFRDGISQPGVDGITTELKPGQELIPAGEFILGYPTQPDNAPPPAQPPGAYQPVPAPPPPQFPSWAPNGSFFVFRRLRQDVAGFNQFVASAAGETGLRPDLLEAKLVGRYKSGAPLERTRDQEEAFDPASADPSIADPAMLDDAKINNFEFDPHDADGHLVPRAAHIRKMYPRNEDPPGKAQSESHRILRRGIPYGPDFEPAEPAYPGEGAPPDNQDRGLLFGCYQASIERGFEFLQTQWANQPDFPQAGDGRDPITSQDVAAPEFNLPPDHHLTMLRWVITTGGGYFFSPSLDALARLAGE
jgi:Dyp-type peroxidase family